MGILKTLGKLGKGLFVEAGEAVTENEAAQEVVMRQSIRDAESQKERAHKGVIKLKGMVKTSEAEIGRLKTEHAKYQAAGEKLAENFEANKDKLDKISNEMDNLERLITVEQQKLAAYEQNFDVAKKQLNKIDTQIERLKNTKSMLDSKKEVLEARKSTVTVKGVDNDVSEAMEIMKKREKAMLQDEAELDAAIEVDGELTVDVDAILAETETTSASSRFGTKS